MLLKFHFPHIKKPNKQNSFEMCGVFDYSRDRFAGFTLRKWLIRTQVILNNYISAQQLPLLPKETQKLVVWGIVFLNKKKKK